MKKRQSVVRSVAVSQELRHISEGLKTALLRYGVRTAKYSIRLGIKGNGDGYADVEIKKYRPFVLGAGI